MSLSVRVIVITMATPFLTAPLLYAAPIHEAAKAGDFEGVERLIATGADVNARRFDGATPLRLAQSREARRLLRDRGGTR